VKYTIACVDCGEQFMAKRKHAKYDPHCKALRQALAVRKFPMRCPGHHAAPHYFYRLDGYERYCIECCLAGLGKALKPMAQPCERCELLGTEFYPGSPICIECVQLIDQPHADEVTRWLLAQRKERLGKLAPAPSASSEPEPDEPTPAEQVNALPAAGKAELDELAQSLLAGKLSVGDYRALEADILRRHTGEAS
jgi:hypothetical protein